MWRRTGVFVDNERESEVDSANASKTQALTLRGLSNPGVMRMGVVYREAVGRWERKREGGSCGTIFIVFLKRRGACTTAPPLFLPQSNIL